MNAAIDYCFIYNFKAQNYHAITGIRWNIIGHAESVPQRQRHRLPPMTPCCFRRGLSGDAGLDIMSSIRRRREPGTCSDATITLLALGF